MNRGLLVIIFSIFFGFLTQEDRDNRDFYLKNYATHSIEETGSLRIPEVLHCIWLGHSPFPSAQNLAKWKKAHPNWRVCFWTDQRPPVLPAGIEIRKVEDFSFQFLGTLYDSAENYGEKSEILRLEILYQEGGVYIDHDTRPLQPLDALNRCYDFYAGLEKEGPTVLSTSIFPSTHLMAANPHHSVIHDTMAAWVRLKSEVHGEALTPLYARVKRLSSLAFSEGARSMGTQGAKDRVFPSHYFSEKHSKKGVYATHAHLGSWHQFDRMAEEKVLQRIRGVEKKIGVTQILLLLSLCLNLFLFGSLLKQKKLVAWLPLLLIFVGCQKEEITEFEKLMGKKTEHWRHIHEQEDYKALAKFESLYEKNKHYLKAPPSGIKIPPLIHFIWLGPKSFPPESVENVRTWIARHPTWRVKFWTDRPRPLPCSHMELCSVDDFNLTHLKQCYLDSNNYGEKSDILRYEILLQEGGVYVDHDANCLDSFEALHSHFDFYCGLEAPHPPFAGSTITSGNGVLGARPNHPVTQRVIDFIGENWEATSQKIRGKDPASQSDLVLARTYIALTRALETSIALPPNIDIVLPSAYFFAKQGIPSLYSQHFYATAWAENQPGHFPFHRSVEKKLSRVHKKSAKVAYCAGILLLLNLLLLAFYTRQYKRRKV